MGLECDKSLLFIYFFSYLELLTGRGVGKEEKRPGPRLLFNRPQAVLEIQGWEDTLSLCISQSLARKIKVTLGLSVDKVYPPNRDYTDDAEGDWGTPDGASQWELEPWKEEPAGKGYSFWRRHWRQGRGKITSLFPSSHPSSPRGWCQRAKGQEGWFPKMGAEWAGKSTDGREKAHVIRFVEWRLCETISPLTSSVTHTHALASSVPVCLYVCVCIPCIFIAFLPARRKVQGGSFKKKKCM